MDIYFGGKNSNTIIINFVSQIAPDLAIDSAFRFFLCLLEMSIFIFSFFLPLFIAVPYFLV